MKKKSGTYYDFDIETGTYDFNSGTDVVEPFYDFDDGCHWNIFEFIQNCASGGYGISSCY
jgi:hypothetical protein